VQRCCRERDVRFRRDRRHGLCLSADLSAAKPTKHASRIRRQTRIARNETGAKRVNDLTILRCCKVIATVGRRLADRRTRRVTRGTLPIQVSSAQLRRRFEIEFPGRGWRGRGNRFLIAIARSERRRQVVSEPRVPSVQGNSQPVQQSLLPYLAVIVESMLLSDVVSSLRSAGHVNGELIRIDRHWSRSRPRLGYRAGQQRAHNQ